jgi:DNA-binding GntR family transcriptional regulator
MYAVSAMNGRVEISVGEASAHLPTRLVSLLERAILRGVFKGGERLEEEILAVRYGVSRTPIREALRELAARGLVEIRPRRGAIVRPVTPADLAEMFEAMAEIEASCARLAAHRASAADLARLEEAQRAGRQAAERGDAEAYATANERFHFHLYEASHNNFLAAETRRIYRRLEPYRRLLFRLDERRAASVREHDAIVDALKRRDEASVEALVKAHIGMLGERFANLVAVLARPEAEEA